MVFPTHFPVDGYYLTAREAEILWLGLQGLTVCQIAGQLYRSPKTINRHRENIRTRFGLTGYHGLQQFAMKIRPELEKSVTLPIDMGNVTDYIVPRRS